MRLKTGILTVGLWTLTFEPFKPIAVRMRTKDGLPFTYLQ